MCECRTVDTGHGSAMDRVVCVCVCVCVRVQDPVQGARLGSGAGLGLGLGLALVLGLGLGLLSGYLAALGLNTQTRCKNRSRVRGSRVRAEGGGQRVSVAEHGRDVVVAFSVPEHWRGDLVSVALAVSVIV